MAEAELALQVETDRTAGRALGHLVGGNLHETMSIFQKTGSRAAQSGFAGVGNVGLFQVELGAGLAVATLVEQYGGDDGGAVIQGGGSEGQVADTGGESETTVTQYTRDHHDLVPLGSGFGFQGRTVCPPFYF